MPAGSSFLYLQVLGKVALGAGAAAVMGAMLATEQPDATPGNRLPEAQDVRPREASQTRTPQAFVEPIHYRSDHAARVLASRADQYERSR